MMLMSVAGGHTDVGVNERRNFLSMLEFLFGIGGGPEGEGMPRDVFWMVLDLLMPLWDPFVGVSPCCRSKTV
jgi:hypothetical protein